MDKIDLAPTAASSSASDDTSSSSLNSSSDSKMVDSAPSSFEDIMASSGQLQRPIGELSLSQKLIKALALVHVALERNNRSTNAFNATDAFQTPKNSNFPQNNEENTGNMNTAECADLLELLASSLKEVSNRKQPYADAGFPPYPYPKVAGYSYADMSFSCVPPVTEENTGKSSMDGTDDYVPTLLLDNLGKLVGLLKQPDSLSYPESPIPCLETQLSPTASIAEAPVQSYITRLPSEILQKVLRQARSLQESIACECGGQSCPQSRNAIQRWALSMALVCKDWRTSAVAAAYSRTLIWDRSQITLLLEAIAQNPVIAEHTTSLDVKVQAMCKKTDAMEPHFLGRRSHRRTQAFPWFEPTTPTSPKSLNGQPPVELLGVSALVAKCPALGHFEYIALRPSCYMYSGGSSPSDFLEKGLSEALAHSTCLRSLTFKQCIDYGEIEELMLAIPTLEHLRCEGGLDNLDGRDDVIGASHKCHLQTVYINNVESTELGENQLCWILSSSIGTLRSLEVATSIVLNQNGNAFPAYAGGIFANLLVDLAPTLTRLALKDCLHSGMGGMPGNLGAHPGLRAAPHNGSFDYALERCIRLADLCIDWCLTGETFLSAVVNSPLENLVLLGPPSMTSGAAFIKHVSELCPTIRKITLSSFTLHGPAPAAVATWSARDIRQLRRVCESKSIMFDFL